MKHFVTFVNEGGRWRRYSVNNGVTLFAGNAIAVGRAMLLLESIDIRAWAIVRADGVVIAQSVGADVSALKAEAA